MSDPMVMRIAAVAELDDPDDHLDAAAAAAQDGDGDMQAWIEAHADGRAFLLKLRSTALARDGDGEEIEVSVENHGVWIESAPHLPLVEHQIHEVINKDADALAEALSDRGVSVPPRLIADMFVHLELSDALREALVEASGRYDGVQRTPQTRLPVEET